MDDGAKTSPDMYMLGVRHIFTAIENHINQVEKENVRRVYVEPMLAKRSDNMISVKIVKYADVIIIFLQLYDLNTSTQTAKEW